jgi:hypothetical protein
MPRMDAMRKIAVLVATLVVALSLVAGPAFAVEDAPAGDPPVEAPAGDGDHRVAIAETPRDRLGLIFLGALVLAGLFGLMNARRQLKGERPSASGEFRWR